MSAGRNKRIKLSTKEPQTVTKRCYKPPKLLQDFPTEILIKIFEFVSFKDRLKLSETCKRFFDITSDSKFIRKFRLNLKYKKIIDGLREYQKIRVWDSQVEFFVPLFDTIGASVTTLEIHGDFKSKVALEIIKKCQKLKILTISVFEGHFDGSGEPLDEISLDNFDIQVPMELFMLFKNVQTKSLRCKFNDQTVDFILNQKDLKHLTLQDYDNVVHFTSDQKFLDANCALESLKLLSARISQWFERFIKFYRNSLQKIEIFGCSSNFIRHMRDFPHLKTVKLLGAKAELWKDILMPQVEELILDSCRITNLKSFPNIKKLSILSKITNNEFWFNIQHCKQLEELKLNLWLPFHPFRLPPTLKKFTLSGQPPQSEHRKIPLPFNMDNKIEELEIYNTKTIQWLAVFLFHVHDRKVKITLKDLNCVIPRLVEQAFKEHEDKIEELKIVGCEFRKNSKNSVVKFRIRTDDLESDEFDEVD